VINLLTQFYFDKSIHRSAELEYCLSRNVKNQFDNIYLFVEDKLVERYVKEKYPRCKVINIGKRALFNDFFELLEKQNQDSINIITNSDIFFDDLSLIKIEQGVCYALSRYDYHIDGSTTPFLRPDSQDTWIFYGCPKIRTQIDYGMGMAGCDNRLAHDLSQQGLTIKNPSYSIKTYHYHDSNVRNYLGIDETPTYRVPTPYLLVTPC
jgi:hypothetical protein